MRATPSIQEGALLTDADLGALFVVGTDGPDIDLAVKRVAASGESREVGVALRWSGLAIGAVLVLTASRLVWKARRQ